VPAANLAWYAIRASGFVALVALSVAVLVGVTLSGGARLPHWPRFAVEDVHAFAGMLTGTFVVLHGGLLLVDDYFSFSLGDVLVPGGAPYRPLAVAFGVVAAEILAALALTNRYRRRLPYTFWRRAHYANFAVWWLALLHGIASGTDSDTVWGLSLYVAAAGAVVSAVVWRACRAPAPAL
jgi:sulfoxide reductase heme-binding subunit YedZ